MEAGMEGAHVQNLSKFGLMNALIGIVNSGAENEADTVIAAYLLAHFNTLNELSIYDIAEACFTTRQSVRRFCQRIGLDNFRAFKKEQLAMEYYGDYHPVANYPEVLARELGLMAQEVNEVALPYLDRFCDEIHRADRCVFLVSDIYSAACLEFQKQLILYGKMVRIVSNNFQNNLVLGSLTERDLVITVSISGRWARELLELIEATSAWRVLITAMHDDDLISEFDEVFHVSRTDKPQVKTAYHLFAIPYLLEIVQKRYRDRYLPHPLHAPA